MEETNPIANSEESVQKLQTPKRHTIDQLNECYRTADECDSEVFAEQRSNLLLESGNHYSRKVANGLYNQVRNSAKLSESQKLRLTKNHIQKVTKTYKNAILEKMPGVTISPHNELEIQDKKSAEINLAVWKDAQDRYNLSEHRREGVSNFVTLGERCTFVYFDETVGGIRGYEQATDPATGVPLFDQQGNPVPDMARPIFNGGLVYKQVPAYNLLRARTAKSMKNSPYHIIREMIDVKELEMSYANDTVKLGYIKGAGDDEFIVFDSNKKAYSDSKSEILVRYHFYRPCKQYPNGYFYIAVKGGILEEGELPFGLYPIVWSGFDIFSDNARASSIIKVARPFQAEINRASSQMATHQVTVGDDKIIYQGGTKLAPGALLPGVRGITYQGQAPQILPGRDGSQFLPYIQAQISELYDACMLSEITMDAPNGQSDPYNLLFQSASQQKAFKDYVWKTEEFEKELCLLTLEFAKRYYSDDMVIKIAGKSEAVNIAEFKSTQPNSFVIKAEPQSETIDSRLGKQLALNHLLQYAGSVITPKQIGLIAKEMPFLNNQSMLKYLTTDYDNVENDILALERGEQPDISPYADNKLYVDAYTHRMKQADFKILPDIIKQQYMNQLSAHEGELARKAKAEQAAKDGFIPTDGALITCSMHIPDSSKESGTKQVRLPYTSLMWLIERLNSQGQPLEMLEQMNGGVIADIVGQMQSQQMPQAPMQQQPTMM